ncbi:hypothetical protein K151_45 [Proteus hauseri ZMd44]|nr:hypothetical protein K151_45 [Proteus hauseri ZMd44]
MNVNNSIFNPKFSFSKVSHRYPKKEEYIISKNISEVKNTPVSPFWGKRIIQVLTSLFHKLEIRFLIRGINNNKPSSDIDKNKYNNIFNEASDEIKNKNLKTISDIVSHANDKFDFYSYCDYLTELKRAKDFFLLLSDKENECSERKLITEMLNEIIKNRINAIDDEGIKNVFKLINSKFRFENIHLNKKYDFMHNFSTEKERVDFIKIMNFLLIGVEEAQLFDRFVNNIKSEVEKKLSTIMMIALDKNTNNGYSFDSLKQEWKEKYISDHDNVTKSDVIEETDIGVHTDISHDIEVETIIEIAKQAPKEDLSAKYIDVDNFNVDDYQLILRNKIDNIKKTDEKNNSELDEYKSTLDSDIDNTKEIIESDDLDYQWDYEVSDMVNFDGKKLKNDILMEKINKLTLGLKSDEKFNEINNKLESMIHDIEECSTEGGGSLDLDKKLTFSRDNYQWYFDTEENKSETNK